jgi:large subunit ribosomal protein L22
MADTNVVRAYAKGVTMTPRKVSLVASLVRGRTVADALVILQHTPKRAAKPVAKAIASAQANATNNHRLDGKTLVLSTLSVTAGPRLRRIRAGARGMTKPYQKRTSHILVEVTGVPKAVKKPAAAAVKPAKAAPKKEEK